MSGKESYKETFKATSLFGGVQVFNIIISLVRSKIVAVLLGTGGYGILGILQSPLGIIGLITEMGLGASSVRDIAKAKEEGDIIKISQTVKIVRRWVWLTGILGLVVIVALSPLLSKWTDEKTNYTWAFVFLSITLLFSALSGGQTAILRGLRRLKDTAKVGVIGSFFGLIISIPFYYFWGIKGIVPAIITSSFIGLMTSWYFSRKVELVPVTVSYKESFLRGGDMIKLGIIITMSNLTTQVVSYLIILYIKNQSGESMVGLYNAGWAMTNQYIGVIFTAMTIDYFPRLVSMQSNREKMVETVNHQAEIAILIIAPLMLIYLSCLPLIIRLIYTGDFLPAIHFIKWVIIGMLFKASSWALSHIIVAKGDNKLFFFSELIANIVLLTMNIVGYALYGLEGIGIAFVLQYLLYFFAMYLIAKKKYKITFNKEFNKLFLFQLALSVACFLTVVTKGYPFAYVVGIILFLISAFFSLKKLNEKMDIRKIFKNVMLLKN